MNSEYRSSTNFSNGMNSYSSNYDNKFSKMNGSGKFGNIMEGYSSRNSSFPPQRQQQIMPRSNMQSQSGFQHRGSMPMGHQMHSSPSSDNMNKSGTCFFSSFGSDARSYFKSTFSSPLENHNGPSMGSHPMDVNNRQDFVSPSSSSLMLTRQQSMNSSNNSYNYRNSNNINSSNTGTGKQQHFGRRDAFEPSGYRQHGSNMFGQEPTTNRFDPPTTNFRDDSLSRKTANGLSSMNDFSSRTTPTRNNQNYGGKSSTPSGGWKKRVLNNGYVGKKRFNTSPGLQASKNRVPAAKASNLNSSETNKMSTNQIVSSCSNDSASHNQESTPEESCVELAEKNRVSALKRLGPKLSIVDRLGNKVSKKGVASEDEKVIKKSDTNEKKDTKTPEGSLPNATHKVICPHCGTSRTSKEEYNKHLGEANHAKAMKQLKYRLMVTLNNMRSRQKAALDEIEKKEGFVKTGAIFCKTCKIIHHSKRVEHIETELHKCIEKFLKPNCTYCDSEFQSPMAFETHNSTYNHLKKVSEGESSRDVLESEDINMEDLVTVDEVGVVDDEIGGGILRRTSEEDKTTPEKSSVTTKPSSEKSSVTTKPSSEKPSVTSKPSSEKSSVTSKPSSEKSSVATKSLSSEKSNIATKSSSPEKSNVTTKSSPKKTVTPSKSLKVASKKEASVPQENPKVKPLTPQPKEAIKAPLESETQIKTEPLEEKILQASSSLSAEEGKEENENENSENLFIEESNSEIPLGTSFIRRVEILFCDVCMQFLPEEKVEMFDSLIESHCKSESHQIAFIEMRNKMNDKDFAFNEDELDYEPDENE